jgi:C1A family cysteine protease
MAVSHEDQVIELQAKLRRYEEFEEDMLAQRVFVKARRQIVAWITFGGLATALVGVLGFSHLSSDIEDGAKTKLASIAPRQVNAIVEQEVHRRITPITEKEDEALQTIREARVATLKGAITFEGQSGPGLATVSSVDYAPQMLAVRDSGSEGSVVGFAVASALEYQLKVHGPGAVRISPRYLYYYARKAGHLDLRTDSGANLDDAMAVLKAQGAVAESAWPYVPGKFASSPPDAAARAKHYRANSRPLDGIDEIKAALQHDGPIVAGISVYASLDSPSAAKTGVVPDPKPDEQVAGGHAICIVGYDDARRRFKFENSWGPRWGAGGYGYVSYDYIEKHGAGAWALSL